MARIVQSIVILSEKLWANKSKKSKPNLARIEIGVRSQWISIPCDILIN